MLRIFEKSYDLCPKKPKTHMKNWSQLSCIHAWIIHETINARHDYLPQMQIFTCSCGEEILIVPDIKTMNKPLKNHIPRHKKTINQPIKEEDIVEERLKQVANGYFQLNRFEMF